MHIGLHAHVEFVEGRVVTKAVRHFVALGEPLRDSVVAHLVGALEVLLFVVVRHVRHEAVRAVGRVRVEGRVRGQGQGQGQGAGSGCGVKVRVGTRVQGAGVSVAY